MEWSVEEYAKLIKNFDLKIDLLTRLKLKKDIGINELYSKVPKTDTDDKRITVLQQDKEEIINIIREMEKRKEQIKEKLDDLEEYINNIE